MKKLIILVAALVLGSPSFVCAAEPTTTWTTQDTVLQVITLGLLEVDRKQTHWISKNPVIVKGDTYETTNNPDGSSSTIHRVYLKSNSEINPLIGKNASASRINKYFVSVALAHTGVSVLLRKSGTTLFGVPTVTLWQSLVIGVEAAQIGRNYHLGVKLNY